MFGLFEKDKKSEETVDLKTREEEKLTEESAKKENKAAKIAEMLEESDEKLEKWIEVEGYKGMDKDMKGHYNFQYEIGKTYVIEDPSSVKACEYGYHFSLNLKDVFDYYKLSNNNRFFKVKALVRKSDYEDYGKVESGYIFVTTINKLAAKQITILKELSDEEMYKEIKSIYKDTMIDKLKITDMPEIYDKGIMQTLVNKCSRELQDKMNFSEPFVHFLTKNLDVKESLDLLNSALLLSDEMKDRDLLILAISEQRERIIMLRR